MQTVMVAYITSLASVEQKEDLVSVGLCALSQFPHIHDTLTDLTQVHPERPSQHWQPRRSIATIQFCRVLKQDLGKCFHPAGPLLGPQCRANTYIHARNQPSDFITYITQQQTRVWLIKLASQSCKAQHVCIP